MKLTLCGAVKKKNGFVDADALEKRKVSHHSSTGNVALEGN